MVVLPEPVGPVTSKMPSGSAINRSNVCWSSVKNPSSGKPEPQPFLVENTHDDAFAMVGGQARNAQVNRLAAHLGLDAPVLRDAVFGDGHVGLDLQPR